jgi:hypothetical protein
MENDAAPDEQRFKLWCQAKSATKFFIVKTKSSARNVRKKKSKIATKGVSSSLKQSKQLETPQRIQKFIG